MHPLNCGLSPCVRGNPLVASSRLPSKWVYPRAYGGTSVLPCWRSDANRGGSIPVRTGEPIDPPPVRADSGRSIPVRTGEPRLASAVSVDLFGLSPCVRGNHHTITTPIITLRSIPVRTGEPFAGFICLPTIRGLSPCVRGNRSMAAVPGRKVGLSPCVRGNRVSGPHCPDAVKGSIPVRTGEPNQPQGRGPSIRQWTWEVYPRAYGGTREWT